MGVGVEKNTKNETKLKESDVTMAGIASMDIEQILEHISAYESAINNDLSLSTVQTLTTLYQKAIEYYSALDDLLYNDFLNRMQSLLQREDIQIVMNSFDEDQKSRLAPAVNKHQADPKTDIVEKPDFDVGDEVNEVTYEDSNQVEQPEDLDQGYL